MNWEQLLSSKRFGREYHPDLAAESIRTEFQRDYDRIIFSSPFRRLQNKTQVFPLPGSVFVHNRLTHSLEVASIGRSLGHKASLFLKEKYPTVLQINEIETIVGTACLAHDLGNPPFGHSGEKAISDFFLKGDGAKYKNHVTEEQWFDLLHFEGNANALRLLTHTFNGRRQGGFVLTYATLASLIKYPFSSVQSIKKHKYGYFNTELKTIQNIMVETGQLKIAEGKWCRHPLVYLVEAADDISYQIMDIEDAHKLKILTTEETQELLSKFFDVQKDVKFFQKQHEVFEEVTDSNERISFLRAMVINHLANQVAKIFMNHETEIINGTFSGSLVDYLEGASALALKECSMLAVEKIYNNRAVIEIEITGYNVIQTILENYTAAIFDDSADYSKKLIALMPLQYKEQHADDYSKLRSVLDFVSGMTDLYAMDLYKLIKGIGV